MPTLKYHDFGLTRSEKIEEKCKREGKYASIYDINKNIYIGDWKSNKRNGIGKLLYKSGNSYVGQWKNNKRHGFGMLWKNYTDQNILKLIYEGQWKNNHPNGFGVSFLKENSYYQGEFVDGKRNGHGTMVYSTDGSHYTGQWINNIPQGFGMLTDSDGNFYQGQFKDGLCHGPGIFVFPNRNAMLRGLWNNGEWFTGESMKITNDIQF